MLPDPTFKGGTKDLRHHLPRESVIDFLYLGRHGCASKHFLDAQQLFAKTKEYCMAQQELLIRSVSTRAMGEIAYLQKDSTYVKAYFEEAASICHDAGIILELLYRRSSLAFFNKVPRDLRWVDAQWPHFLR